MQNGHVKKLLGHVIQQLKLRCLAGTFLCGKRFIPVLSNENLLQDVLDSPTQGFAAFMSNPGKE